MTSPTDTKALADELDALICKSSGTPSASTAKALEIANFVVKHDITILTTLRQSERESVIEECAQAAFEAELDREIIKRHGFTVATRMAIHRAILAKQGSKENGDG